MVTLKENALILKPWGSEQIIDLNEYYYMKYVCIKEGHQTGVYYCISEHKTIYLLEGIIRLIIENKEYTLHKQDHKVVPPNLSYQIKAIEDSLILECSNN